ncbi:hypothetical protein ACFL23_02390 [Patescibacteria group bacterium]
MNNFLIFIRHVNKVYAVNSPKEFEKKYGRKGYIPDEHILKSNKNNSTQNGRNQYFGAKSLKFIQP